MQNFSKKVYLQYLLLYLIDICFNGLFEVFNMKIEFPFALHLSEWSEGQVTEYLVATFGDYFTDVKM